MSIRLFPDTSREAEAVLIERIRSLSGAQRLAVQQQLNAQMRWRHYRCRIW